MKACFFASRQAYDCNDFRINLVAHSMGGLVSRYYIENLGQDAHVEKLITVDTPHWGSPYGDLSSGTGISHVLCDHDLHSDSAMNHGPNSSQLITGCTALNPLGKCTDQKYQLTQSLKYQRSRCTKYYAIAGLDFELKNSLRMNDYTFEMPTNFTTYQQVENFLRSKDIVLDVNNDNPVLDAILSIGDNLVGFLSQIGWTENDGESPSKRIPMEKIFVDVDTNGGNGPDIGILEFKDMFHGKITHRSKVMKKIYEYLEE